MKLVTVIELSKHTGLTRSQIYYLNKEYNLINLEGKINLEEALNIITALKIKKIKTTNEENFRQILNMLQLQIIALQKQLDLANEREKNYIAELASYRQHLLSKITKNESMHKNDAQIELENNVINTDENSQKPIQSESENQASVESCLSFNKETKSANKAESRPSPTKSIYNEIASPESKGGDTELTRKEKEMTEQNDNALTKTSLPTQHGKELLLNLKKHRKSKAPITQKTKPAKPIYLDPASNKQKAALSINQPIGDQENLNNEDSS